MNELISLLAVQENIPQEGLQKLVIDRWEREAKKKFLKEPIDESVMRSLLNKC